MQIRRQLVRPPQLDQPPPLVGMRFQILHDDAVDRPRLESGGNACFRRYFTFPNLSFGLLFFLFPFSYPDIPVS
jgi:hypothetical protein